MELYTLYRKLRVAKTLYHTHPRNEAKLAGIMGLAPKDGSEIHRAQPYYLQTCELTFYFYHDLRKITCNSHSLKESFFNLNILEAKLN